MIYILGAKIPNKYSTYFVSCIKNVMQELLLLNCLLGNHPGLEIKFRLSYIRVNPSRIKFKASQWDVLAQDVTLDCRVALSIK